MSLIEASAPGRYGLVGNPSDMYGGSVISGSIAERAACTLDTDTDRTVLTLAGESRELRTVADLASDGGVLDLPKAALRALKIDPAAIAPFHLIADSEIPRQSGLAGSTALLTAIIGALSVHVGSARHRYATAELARATEYAFGTLCGFQDAYMCSFGGLHYMDFRDKDVRRNDPDSSPYATMEPLSATDEEHLPVVVAFSGVMHHSGETHASLFDRYCSGDPEAAAAAAEFAGYARNAKRAILENNLDALAAAMTRNQTLIRRLQPQNPANERLIGAALESGALAAKLAGAGGGGSIVAVATPERLDEVAAALAAAGAAAVLRPKPSPGLIARRV